MAHQLLHRGIAQLVEQWSPKPRAEGSSPSAPAIEKPETVGFGLFPALFLESGLERIAGAAHLRLKSSYLLPTILSHSV